MFCVCNFFFWFFFLTYNYMAFSIRCVASLIPSVNYNFPLHSDSSHDVTSIGVWMKSRLYSLKSSNLFENDVCCWILYLVGDYFFPIMNITSSLYPKKMKQQGKTERTAAAAAWWGLRTQRIPLHTSPYSRFGGPLLHSRQNCSCHPHLCIVE